MKLCYWRFPNGTPNFGDDLNPWLWKQLIPRLFDEDDSVAFVGIGTIINERLADLTHGARRRIIFGSGVGYHDSVPTLDESYHVYCVRGPLSAQALQLPEAAAITDPAVLVRRVFSGDGMKSHRFAFMPHVVMMDDRGWKMICEELDITFVDPRSPIEEVLNAISQSEVLFAEAMHGAIIADALRVPWVPVTTHPGILEFKWQDWCQSISQVYEPVAIAPQQPTSRSIGPLAPVRAVRNTLRRKAATLQFRSVLKSARPCLSSDLLIEQRTTQLEEKLQKLQQDVASGLFEHTDHS